MQPYLLAATWAVVAYIVYTSINSFLTKRRNKAEADRLGCGEIEEVNTFWDYGISRVVEASKYVKQNLFIDYITGKYTNEMKDRTHRINLLGQPVIITADPKNIQAVLATQFQDFSLGSTRRNAVFPLLGNGIFSTDGKAWEHSRTLLRPQFTRDQISDLELEENHVQNLMCALPINPKTGWTDETDLSPLFFNLTLDSACEFLLGESVDSQVLKLPAHLQPKTGVSAKHMDKLPFAKAFDKAQEWLSFRFRLQGFAWAGSSAEFRECNKICHDFMDKFVREALASSSGSVDKKETKGGKDRYVFLEALVKETRDPIELRSQLLNILLAGRDTTASLLGYTFLLLSRNPDVYAKLRENVLATYGAYNDTSRISFASLKSNQYLQNIINETLRLYPVVPANQRRAVRDTTLPSGGGPDGTQKIYVPKGTEINYSVYVMHRRKVLWGEDADQYRPDRWVGKRPGWEYLPFNGGPRICIGQQFALTEASYVIVRLLQRFEAIQTTDTKDITQFLTLTSCSGNGVNVKFREAAK